MLRIGNFTPFSSLKSMSIATVLSTLVYHGVSFLVPRGSQKDYRKDVNIGTKVACWFVHNNGQGLIDGVHRDYIIPDLF